jgi:hypothetical protein
MIRNLEFISWSDPLASIENKTSPEFTKAVKEEQELYEENLNKCDPLSIKTWKQLFGNLPKQHEPYYSL